MTSYPQKNERAILERILNTQINLALLKNNLGFHQEAIALLKEVIEHIPFNKRFP